MNKLTAGRTDDWKRLPIDQEFVEISGDILMKNIDRIFLHLRDARVLLRLAGTPVMAKATIIIASAALESNLAYLTMLARAFASARPDLYSPPQVQYLSGKGKTITEKGALKEEPIHDSLERRLQVIPDLLARAIHRRYSLSLAGPVVRKLHRMIEVRDRIIHPRLDQYLPTLTALEAAQAVDAVELYLHSVQVQLHPYLVGYINALFPMRGHVKDDVGIGYRTQGKRVIKSKFVQIHEPGIRNVLGGEWIDMQAICEFAFESGCEGDSEGSSLTRAALAILFCNLYAQLAIVSQWRMQDPSCSFEQAERDYLAENVVSIGLSGEVETEADRSQRFKHRIVAVPTILARGVEGKEIHIDLGSTWAQQLVASSRLRDWVVHAPIDLPLSRVSLLELRTAADSVRCYFADLANQAPETFGAQAILLQRFRIPKVSELQAKIDSANASRPPGVQPRVL